MKLIEVQVTLYRNFVDSTAVKIEPNVTCFVGKNESGKTAFLQALYHLNPAVPESARLQINSDYPRWRKVRDQRQTDLGKITPIQAKFTLEEADLVALSPHVLLPLPANTVVCVGRNYLGYLEFALQFPEKEWLTAVVEQTNLEGNNRKAALKCDNLTELAEFLANHPPQPTEENPHPPDLAQLAQRAAEFRSAPLSQVIHEILAYRLPKFFYFSEYSALPGRIDLTELLGKASNQLEEHERTARALLKLASVRGMEFMEANFEERIAELEAAANEITNQVFEYWTQNPNLIVKLMGDSQVVSLHRDQTVAHRFLDIRLNDLRHQMTTNFESRSSGFRWFFSFITAFSAFENQSSMIVLLDEPGLGLHPRAQIDLLRYIEDKLAAKNQVLFTTHTPFMVNMEAADKIRFVEDLTTRQNPDLGSKILTNPAEVQADTRFPVQTALGFKLGEKLFSGAEYVAVEEPSDLLYLHTLSEHLQSQGRAGLNGRKVVPLGEMNQLATFLALRGAAVPVTVIGEQLETISGQKGATVEDLFTPADFLALYNEVTGGKIAANKLTGKGSIVGLLEKQTKEPVDRYKLAHYLATHPAWLAKLGRESLQQFETLFSHLKNR